MYNPVLIGNELWYWSKEQLERFFPGSRPRLNFAYTLAGAIVLEYRHVVRGTAPRRSPFLGAADKYYYILYRGVT